MKKFTKILKFLATGSTALLLSACYGVYTAYNEEYVDRKGSFKIVDSETKVALKGIKVSYNDKSCNENYSNEDGLVNYCIESFETEELTVYLEDVDGAENGSYPEIAQLTIDVDDDTVDIISLKSTK